MAVTAELSRLCGTAGMSVSELFDCNTPLPVRGVAARVRPFGRDAVA
jgi:hypothetical protein